jgi:hypothetical protein
MPDIDINMRDEMNGVYMSIPEAEKEILRRWNDVELRRKVEEFTGVCMPFSQAKSPMAVLARQILSPNFETLHFLDLVKQTSLTPCCFGYLDDKLVTNNPDKYYLCRLHFDDGIGRGGGHRLSALNIIDFNTWSGKKISDVQTRFERGFVDFHMYMTRSLDINLEFLDGSDYLHEKGSFGKNYYRYFLAMFVCHGVLFENYLLEGEYASHSLDVFLPAFREISSLFGVKPIITRVAPIETENDLSWRYYPQVVYDNIRLEIEK